MGIKYENYIHIIVCHKTVILLLFVYSTSSFGITVYKHYCMNEFVGASLFPNKDNECDKCGMKRNNPYCCKDKQVKLKTGHQKVEKTQNTQLLSTVTLALSNIPFHTVITTKSYSVSNTSLIIGSPPLHILYCIFLI